MADFKKFQENNIVIFDGAMGTSIQELTKEKKLNFLCNEQLNISHPHLIKKIHTDYLSSGANVIETNTFGATPVVLKEYNLQHRCSEINKSAVEIAKSAIGKRKNCFIAGSIGPTSKLPSLEHISFEELFNSYFIQIESLLTNGVDLLQIETASDILQIKTAIVTADYVFKKYKKTLPILVSATFENNGLMLLGTTLESFVATFANNPIVFALGLNCGGGPKQMLNHVNKISKFSPLPISIIPNAGLPVSNNGEMSYDIGPKDFANILFEYVKKYNLEMVGGCCGTTPKHILELSKKLKGYKKKNRNFYFIPSATSLFSATPFKNQPAPLIIGEAANTNGSKKFRKLLEKQNWDKMVSICNKQKVEGSHVLDICLAHIERDEKKDMKRFISILNRSFSLPLMIDTTFIDVAEVAMQNYGGKLIYNSVNFENGEKKVLETITLCKKYSSAFVCLAIDENGMALTKDKKVEIFNRLKSILKKESFPLTDVFFDCLTFSLGTGESDYFDSANQTLLAIREISKRNPEVNLILGISNVSFGLSQKIRKPLNSIFLNCAIKAGLTATIINSAKIIPLNLIKGKDNFLNLIYNRRKEGFNPLHFLIKNFDDIQLETKIEKEISNSTKMINALVQGDISKIDEILKDLLNEFSAEKIINDILLLGMKKVGSMFNSGQLQLPFVLISTQVMKESVNILSPFLNKKKMKKKKCMLLATVEGDVHDIGKNLVKIILENNGFEVIDLGVKVSAQEILNGIKKYKPNCVGLSGLLIKSTRIMKENLLFLAENGVDIPIVLGGAALNKDFVDTSIKPIYKGIVEYAADAFDGLKFIQQKI